MTRIANFIYSQELIHRIPWTARNLMGAFFALLFCALAILFTAEVAVVVAGLIGATAGYVVFNFPKRSNPVMTLRPLWRMRRIHIVSLGSLLSAIVAMLLFLKGIGYFEEQAVRSAGYLALAYAFFAFSVSLYHFGWQNLSEARRKIAEADAEQVHIWRMRADAEGKSFLNDIF